MPIDKPFDRRLRRLRRDRVAADSGGADYLHRRATTELIERLGAVNRDFRDVLVLGALGGVAESLRAAGATVTIADAGLWLAAGGTQCDEDMLPFRDGSFDLVVSVGTLDTVNDLPGALSLIRRALRPDGLFLAAFAGSGSLPRLRSAMLAADEFQLGSATPRIHPQIDVRAAGNLLSRAGFAMPVVDSDGVTVRFSSLASLVKDLRGMGATNLLSDRARLPLGRLGLAVAAAEFAGYADPDGKTAERFEILYLTAWSPAPSQPQPARRGSATASLADALKSRG